MGQMFEESWRVFVVVNLRIKLKFFSLLLLVFMMYACAGNLEHEAESFDGAEMYELGMQASVGSEEQGIAPDHEQTLFWLKKSAGEDYLPAIHALGWIYFEGRGVVVDKQLAARHFSLAAEQGYAESQYMLGLMYVQGWGVEKNSAISLKWIKRAAEQGHSAAQKLLKNLFGNPELSSNK